MSKRADRYPRIGIRSKNGLAKRIAGETLTQADALALINAVLANMDRYWHDNSAESNPAKGKYVRSAAGTKLGALLSLVDRKVLAPHDAMAPGFVVGGMTGQSHIDAAKSLQGHQKQRSLLALDISTFFEQIRQERVVQFFRHKAGCSAQAARLLAQLCTVPTGPKGSGSTVNTLARGFATSTRLSMWCNLDSFERLNWMVKKRLRKHDPRVAIFVDDIGISASRIEEDVLRKLGLEIKHFFETFDHNQRLPINPDKTWVYSYKNGIEHLGLRIGRTRLAMGTKARARHEETKTQLRLPLTPNERRALKARRKGQEAYKQQIAKRNKAA